MDDVVYFSIALINRLSKTLYQAFNKDKEVNIMYRELFRKEIQERVHGCVTVNYDSFIGGYEIRIGTPNLYFSSFIIEGDIERCKNPITLVEQVIIKYELEILKHFIKGKGV